MRSFWYAADNVGPRIHARRLRGRLRDLGVSNLTLARYRQSVERFVGWELSYLGGVACSLELLDEHLAHYVEYLWENGDGRASASQTLAACQHFLLRRRAFPQAWSLVRIWGQFELPQRTPPLPMLVLLALAGIAIAGGKPEFAAGLLLAFRGFLRTGELLACRFGHISLRDNNVIVALPLTKIGARRGQQEVVTFECRLTAHLLQQAAIGRAPGDTVLGVGVHAFRTWWNLSLAKLELNSEVLRPYALRRGGATWELQQSANLELVLLRGRWSSSTVARGYLQEGLALLAQSALSPESRRLMQFYAEQLRLSL